MEMNNLHFFVGTLRYIDKICMALKGLKSSSNDRVFEKFDTRNIFIYSQSFCKKSVVRKSPKKCVFILLIV